MENIPSNIKNLLEERVRCNFRLSQLPYDGTPEIKDRNGKQYLYIRKRIAGKLTSKYVDVFSEELYELLLKNNTERKDLNKQIRAINKQLLELGFNEDKLSLQVMNNIDLARSNIKNLIYSQAVLEGVGATFPQTEDIIENGIIHNVSTQDVQKILNLKHAWEFILDEATIQYPTDYSIYSAIAKIINEGFLYNGGNARTLAVKISGTSYVPPIPDVENIKDSINKILNKKTSYARRATELCMFCMKSQVFQDGNKRAAVILTNHFLISHGAGLLVIEEDNIKKFKELLIDYYEDINKDILKFLSEKCILTPKHT
ncbi:MAG: Fic family protein [Coriobacteriia bacterium]|nr:Fic family protein [Coriobacteriia bacterium]